MMGNTEKVKQLLPADINDEVMCRLAVNIAIVKTLQKLYAHNFMFYSNTVSGWAACRHACPE